MKIFRSSNVVMLLVLYYYTYLRGVLLLLFKWLDDVLGLLTCLSICFICKEYSAPGNKYFIFVLPASLYFAVFTQYNK